MNKGYHHRLAGWLPLDKLRLFRCCVLMVQVKWLVVVAPPRRSVKSTRKNATHFCFFFFLFPRHPLNFQSHGRVENPPVSSAVNKISLIRVTFQWRQFKQDCGEFKSWGVTYDRRSVQCTTICFIFNGRYWRLFNNVLTSCHQIDMHFSFNTLPGKLVSSINLVTTH